MKNRELERTLKAVRAGTEAGAQKVCTSSLFFRRVLDIAFELLCWKRNYRQRGIDLRMRFCIYKRFLSFLAMCLARSMSYCHVLSDVLHVFREFGGGCYYTAECAKLARDVFEICCRFNYYFFFFTVTGTADPSTTLLPAKTGPKRADHQKPAARERPHRHRLVRPQLETAEQPRHLAAPE